MPAVPAKGDSRSWPVLAADANVDDDGRQYPALVCQEDECPWPWGWWTCKEVGEAGISCASGGGCGCKAECGTEAAKVQAEAGGTLCKWCCCVK